VVMSLAIAGLNAEGETVIDTAEAVNVTFPDFVIFCPGAVRIYPLVNDNFKNIVLFIKFYIIM